MKFTSPDQVLHRYAALREQIASPHSAGGVLQSGIEYAKKCPHCKGETWTQAAQGKPPRRTYFPVCTSCRKPWPAWIAEIRAGQIEVSRTTGGWERKYADLGTLLKILLKLGLWERRVWGAFILEPLRGPDREYERLAEQIYGKTGGYELLAALCQRRWPRKHAKERDGFFTPRNCRTLVKEARETTERHLRRVELWEESPESSISRELQRLVR